MVTNFLAHCAMYETHIYLCHLIFCGNCMLSIKKRACLFTLSVLFVGLCCLLYSQPSFAATSSKSPEFSWQTPTFYGSGTDKFAPMRQVYDIVRSSSGYFYVSDTSNNRIVMFNSDGTYYSEWGSYGTGNGQLYAPCGIAVDSLGNVYVAESFNNRIQKFTWNGEYITKWGGGGSGTGQFNLPTFLAIDLLGYLYVTDTENNRVQKFQLDGTFVATWGSYGSGNGYFYEPTGITIDASSNIYVAEFGNHRVQKFNTSGGFITKWGSRGSGNGQFYEPYDVYPDPSGDVYVADTYNHRIQRFTSAGAYVAQWGSQGTADGQFNQPRGLEMDALGNIYVADTFNCRIQKFTSAYAFVEKWGSYGSVNGNFKSPTGIARDTSGNLYVSDTYNYRIQKFDSAGVYLTKWGSQGSGNGQFSAARGVAVDTSGNVYVVDTGNNRVQKFDTSGVFSTTWGTGGTGDGQFNSPMGIAVDSTGNVYVSDTNNYRVQKFSPTGTLLTKWGSQGSGNGQFDSPRAITVDQTGNVYVTESGNNRVQKFTSTGTFIAKWGSSGTGDAQFDRPNGVAVDSDGNVYVADTYQHRVQKFNPNGVFLTKWGSFGGSSGKFISSGGIAIDSSRNIYVVDTFNDRIQFFTHGSPAVSEIVPTSGSTIIDDTPSITFISDEDATCRMSFSDESYDDMSDDTLCDDSGTSHSCVSDDLGGDGAKQLYMACADSAGNENDTDTNTGVTYVLDTTPPSRSSFDPPLGSTITEEPLIITFLTDVAATCRYSLFDESYEAMADDVSCDGGGTMSQSCTAPSLGEDGMYDVYIACVDEYGNGDTAGTNEHLSYVLDTTPPSKTSFVPSSGSSISDTTPDILFMTDEEAACRLSLSDESFEEMSDDIACGGGGTMSQSCIAPDLGEDGTYEVFISCADEHGNSDTVGTNEHLTYVLDTTPPDEGAFDPPPGSTVTDDEPIKFTTDEDAFCRISLFNEQYDEMQDSEACLGDGTTTHSCTLPPLEGEGDYTLYIACEDENGNEGEVQSVQYTIKTRGRMGGTGARNILVLEAGALGTVIYACYRKFRGGVKQRATGS
jgi:DNA-binding beta-propeller fold protein YncE